MDLYRPQILDLYNHPLNYGRLDNPDCVLESTNPSCGDLMRIEMGVRDGKIAKIKFSGVSCAIARASASLLTESLKGKKIEDLKKLQEKDILNLLKAEISAGRMKCALLPLDTLKQIKCQ